MITRDEAIALMDKLDFIEKVLEHPHHITGPDRKQALQNALDVWQYFRDLPIWPQKKGVSTPPQTPSEGTNATSET